MLLLERSVWDVIVQTALEGPSGLARLLDERSDWWMQLAGKETVVEDSLEHVLPWNEKYSLLTKQMHLIPPAVVKLGMGFKEFSSNRSAPSSQGFISTLSETLTDGFVLDAGMWLS